MQFDSDHVLDVHEARLYPFDTYILTSSLYALDHLNQSVPIRRAVTIDQSSNFLIAGSDVESYVLQTDGTRTPSRELDLHIRRAAQTRTFTLVLFAASWMLTHLSIGHIVLACMTTDAAKTLKHLLFSFGILMIHPQLRNSMPDAPGYDGKAQKLISYDFDAQVSPFP